MSRSFLLLCLAAGALAQTYPTRFEPAIARAAKVRAALEHIDAHRQEQLAEWIRITEIAAPSRQEQRRAAYVRAQLEAAGLSGIASDEAGNVWAVRKGSGGGESVLFAAHMDTVFPADTPVHVRRDGGTLRAPGVFDNSASVANLLAAARAIERAALRTKGDLIYLFTVQEEIGLRGMRHWLERNRGSVSLVVALDSGLPGVYYGALGIRWLKFIYTAEGAHTNNSKGKPNPARAVARAIQNIYTLESPGVYNVGMIGGGKVFNAISQESYFTVDIRSNDPAVYQDLSERIRRFAEDAAKQERVGFRTEVSSDAPAGGTEQQLAARRAHPIVQTAVDIQTFLDLGRGRPIRAVASGSTDANIGVEMGIPSIAVGRAFGGDQHTLQEYADIDSAYLGAKQIILLAVSLAQIVE